VTYIALLHTPEPKLFRMSKRKENGQQTKNISITNAFCKLDETAHAVHVDVVVD
jgi:hypothetical protein